MVGYRATNLKAMLSFNVKPFAATNVLMKYGVMSCSVYMVVTGQCGHIRLLFITLQFMNYINRTWPGIKADFSKIWSQKRQEQITTACQFNNM